MSEPAHQILKDARKEAGLTQIQVAALLSVSVEQVKRMERGDWIPEMADVDMMEEQLRDVGLFRRWARAQYPEIVKYFGASDSRELGLLGAVVNTKHQIDDVLKRVDGVSSEYMVEIDHVNGKDHMRLTVEATRSAGSETLEREIADTFKQKIGIKIEASAVPLGALPRSEKKTVRIIDRRYN